MYPCFRKQFDALHTRAKEKINIDTKYLPHFKPCVYEEGSRNIVYIPSLLSSHSLI